MEHKIIKPDKDFEPQIQAKGSDKKSTYPDEESDQTYMYWFDYPYGYPLMPMIDITLLFTEFKKWIEKFLTKKDINNKS